MIKNRLDLMVYLANAYVKVTFNRFKERCIAAYKAIVRFCLYRGPGYITIRVKDEDFAEYRYTSHDNFLSGMDVITNADIKIVQTYSLRKFITAIHRGKLEKVYTYHDYRYILRAEDANFILIGCNLFERV